LTGESIGDQLPAPPVLGLVLSDVLPHDFAGDVEARLSTPDMPVRVDRMRMGPFAGVELYLPTAVMLFVSAGYFNGFLQKLGEDHYEVVKGAARSLFQRASALRLRMIGSPGKASSSGFSLSYSVTGELVPGLRLKLVLQTEIDGETGEKGVSAFLDLLRRIHLGDPSEEELAALLAYRPLGGVVVVTFDAATNTIVPVPPPGPLAER